MILSVKAWAFLALCQAAVLADTPKVYWDKLQIKNSETLPGNLLPQFLFLQTHVEGGGKTVALGGGRGQARPFIPDDSCTDDIFEGAMEDMRSPQLPYLTQDQWTCERTVEEIDVLIYENEALKVTISPDFGGKVWGIWDKTREREWLFNNKAHQPANIGALKSWVAGGAEWNWSPGIVGHSAFTESPTWTSIVDTEKGPMVRVFEFDRYNGTLWQVDMLLDGDTFWAHPRVVNPTDKELRGYWWTCVAVDSKPTTRIFAPATHVAHTTRDPMRDAPWPWFAGSIENSTFQGVDGEWPVDNSYLGNILWGDFFLRIPSEVYSPYIGHTEQDGFVLIHGHPLNGTKFFTWGQNGPGRFMQDFLGGGAENREGDYTELQVGPAPTQMQNFPVHANSVMQWSEWFRGFNTDPAKMAGEYQTALDEIDQWMRSEQGMPHEKRDEIDSFFQAHVDTTPSKMIYSGMPWGAVEELRLGKKLVKGLDFELPEDGTLAYDEALPWVDLVKTGNFSERALNALPLSFQTTDAWMDLLVSSAQKSGYTWLHYFHIGVGLMERGSVDEARSMFRHSLGLKPNPVSARNLALLETTYEAAWPYYLKAWAILNGEWREDQAFSRLQLNLASEMLYFLQTVNWLDKMEWFLSEIPSELLYLDAAVSSAAKVALAKQDVDKVVSLLSDNCFPTYARERADLIDMWNSAQEIIRARDAGRALSNVEKHRARVENPPPRNIGCPYADFYCTTYW